jgi:glycosyltransferase involved in cell wall biosynthesis
MDFSIIIPAFNEEKLLPHTLKSCIDSLKELSAKFAGEIIVVDNNSSDGTAEIARLFGAKLVFEKENCIARARNKGAESALGNFLIFIDADTLAPAELIEKAIEAMKNGSHCGGGSLVGLDDEKIGFLPHVLTTIWNWGVLNIFHVAAGSFLFCLKDAWSETGGFDEHYYASEEVHFSIALRRWGKKRKMKFKIVPIKVKSSSRKFKTYPGWTLFRKIFLLLIFPPALKKKKFCSIWYERKT